MNAKYLRNKPERYGIILALLLTLALFGEIKAQETVAAFPVEARETSRQLQNGDDRYDTFGSQLYRSALRQGVRDGISQGGRDARRKRSASCEKSKKYAVAERGYKSERGSFPAFQSAYRTGFLHGYYEAFYGDENNQRRKD